MEMLQRAAGEYVVELIAHVETHFDLHLAFHEYAETLKDLFGGRPLPEATARVVSSDMLCGIRHVHARGIVHRDIKPSNILIQVLARRRLARLPPQLPPLHLMVTLSTVIALLATCNDQYTDVVATGRGSHSCPEIWKSLFLASGTRLSRGSR